MTAAARSTLPRATSEPFRLDHVLVEVFPDNRTFGLSALEPDGTRATSVLFSGFLKPEMAGELRRLADRIDELKEIEE
ncbi:hypothetical protein [Phaeobacter sp. 22II1-1F12B]|uniref:hypothetical protein n=1 Tax=Phaeobacter sp. 22II1-1F12B TaxID=1317111 RepID=UPI001187106C|nr:hypothetical protein [Phaeobacter sp. 22II1-1F12B]